MSTLESCTDALLQQKVVQASNYERLESRLMELERMKRSLFFGLKEVITDVERRRQDLGELREESARLQQQLQQGSLRFDALVAFIGEEQKKSLRLQEALETCSTAWAGCPTRVTFVLRALQECGAFYRQLTDVVTALTRVRVLMEMVQLTDAAKKVLHERFEWHDCDTKRVDDVLQKIVQEQMELKDDKMRSLDTAQNNCERVWRSLHEKERQLLTHDVALAEARLYCAAEEDRSSIYRMILQAALTIADVHCVARDRMALSSKFGEWRCVLLREAIANVEVRTSILTEIMANRVSALELEEKRVTQERERAADENATSRNAQMALRDNRAALEHRVESIRLLQSAVYLFCCQQQKRLHQISCERVRLDNALASARAAHEARVLSLRMRALQQEAREGLLAEESLVRGALEAAEGDARCVIGDLQAQSLSVSRARAETRIAEAATSTHLPRLQRKDGPQKVCLKKDADKTVFHMFSNTSSKNTVSTVRRGNATNTESHTEAKKKRSRTQNALLSSAAVARHTYPESRQQQKAEENASSQSSNVSLGDFLTLGARLPLSAIKSTTTKRPPLQQLPTNVENGRGAARKKGSICKGLTDAAARHFKGNSPLPRPPIKSDVQCTMGGALGLSLTRATPAEETAAAKNASTTVTQIKGKAMHVPRPCPSVVSAKDMWGEGKAEDVFADIFLF